MLERARKAAAIGYELIGQGYAVIAPVTQSLGMLEGAREEWNDEVEDGGWEFWKKCDLRLVECCDAVVVLMLEGWEDSKGVAAEVEWAQSIGIPVVYWDGLGDFEVGR